MTDYKLPRTTTINGEVYINAQDLIETINNHKEHVGGDKISSYANSVFQLAHDQIIEIIQLFSSKL
jgi:hypothetical protein